MLPNGDARLVKVMPPMASVAGCCRCTASSTVAVGATPVSQDDAASEPFWSDCIDCSTVSVIEAAGAASEVTVLSSSTVVRPAPGVGATILDVVVGLGGSGSGGNAGSLALLDATGASLFVAEEVALVVVALAFVLGTEGRVPSIVSVVSACASIVVEGDGSNIDGIVKTVVVVSKTVWPALIVLRVTVDVCRVSTTQWFTPAASVISRVPAPSGILICTQVDESCPAQCLGLSAFTPTGVMLHTR